MFGNLLKARRSRASLGCKGYRPRVERLEDRLLLNADPHLHFDTELMELNLSGGPYPMPLASDPTNALGDSVDGYGFVDTEVSITVSSQRPADAIPPGPGPPSIGLACVSLDGVCGILEPIHPPQLDGQTFSVDSFFDVFFDITVTDVDSRPGRDFAGQPDGASFLLPNNGPTRMQSLYEAVFDKDAPNYGLVPPPELAPYFGGFALEIPLGGDINGNGENDKIKFTIVSHAAGDEDRTFIQLPDGTVLEQFDSAAFLQGAIVDESTDPPFTLGAGSPAAPAFSGPGALTGPTMATSTLLNPVANPGFSYVDANNNQLFEAGIDVALVNGELEDGFFDTTVAEGGYTAVIPGAGLVIEVALTGTEDLDYRAEGDLVVHATLDADQDIGLRGADVVVKADATADGDIDVEANVSVDVSGATLDAGSDLTLQQHESIGSIDVTGSTLLAGRDLELIANESPISSGAVTLNAGENIVLGTLDMNLVAAIHFTAGGSSFINRDLLNFDTAGDPQLQLDSPGVVFYDSTRANNGYLGGLTYPLEDGGVLRPLNRPPEADANGPYVTSEGAQLTFDASASTDPDDDPLQYRWDFEGDGTWDTDWSSEPTATYVWGDDWTGTATVEVTDGAESSTATASVTVNNVAPTLTLDTAEAIAFGGGEAFLGRVGVEQSHDASATDPGSDALTFEWDFDVTTVTSAYFVDPILDPAGPDPVGSQNVDPRDVSDTESVTFTGPGVYTVTVTVTDDDGGSDSLELVKLVTGDVDDARTQGFWRRQFAGKKKQHIQDEALMAYLDIVNFASRVFSEEVPLTSLEQARDVFQPGGPDVGDPHRSNMKGKATQQALAAWLNFASGAIPWDEVVPTGQPSDPEAPFSEAIMAIEDILLDLDGDEDHEDYVLANQIATAINEMDQ